LAPQVYGKSF